MENIGKEPNRVHGTIHGPGYAGGQALSGNHTWTDANIADAFRVFAVEWQTNQIKWFVDGIHYFTATPTNLPTGAKWVFDRPQFIILNVAVGGNWPGKPDEKTVFPQRMEVDHVRVYAMTNLPGIDADGGQYLEKP
jgi:beta-glucanase (GH16 family)